VAGLVSHPTGCRWMTARIALKTPTPGLKKIWKITEAVATENAKGVASRVRNTPMPLIGACSARAIKVPRTRPGTTVRTVKATVLRIVSRSAGEAKSSWNWAPPTKSAGRPKRSLPWRLR